MLNSKQRAQLRGLANSLEPIFQIGKGGVNDQLIRQVSIVSPLKAFGGCAFDSLPALVADYEGSTTLLLKYFDNSLAIAVPTAPAPIITISVLIIRNLLHPE